VFREDRTPHRHQLDAIVARDSRFAKDAYRLVLAAIEKAFADHYRNSPDKPPNHISAKELLELLRLHATETLGPDAKPHSSPGVLTRARTSAKSSTTSSTGNS
jgi:hypothetical protein